MLPTPTSDIDSDDPHRLCLAMQLRPDIPMSPTEISRYLDLILDERWVPSPVDDRWTDWTGPIEQQRQVQVRELALFILKRNAGEAAAPELERRLPALPYARAAAELFSFSHPLFRSLATHPDPEIRLTAVKSLSQASEYTAARADGIWGLLITDEDDRIATAMATVINNFSWFPSSATKSDLYERALARANGSPLRQQILAIAALRTRHWPELAAIVLTLPPPSLDQLSKLILAESLTPLMQASPAAGAALRAPVFAHFRSARPGNRYRETGLICCYAPDPEAFSLALEELRLRDSAASEMLPFLRHDPAIMPTIVDAVLNQSSNDQAGAIAVERLFEANPEAFARAIKAGAHLTRIAKCWSYLPDSRDADRLVAQLRQLIA